MRRALYPGSFDPVTEGHLDVIRRATALFDEVVVAVAINDEKTPLFSADERIDLIRAACPELSNLRVLSFDGLVVELAKREKVAALVRGLRAVSDFEFEFQMALMNRRLCPGLETVFLTSQEESTYLRSRLVKEVARLGGDISSFVPPVVAKALGETYQ